MKKNYFILITLFVFTLGGNAQTTATWSTLVSGTTTNLMGISAPSASVCYVSGVGGLIRKTADGGITWAAQISGTSNSIFSLYFTDDLTGYAVGDNNTALKTINGGATWTIMPVPSGSLNFRFVTFIDANIGYITGGNASGGSILKTTNAGVSWAATSISSPAAPVYSVFFSSAATGYATESSGKILKTTNNGANWSDLISGTSMNLQNVYLTDANNGIVAGENGTIRKTNDAGATWTAVTVPGITGEYLSGIDFLDSSNGFITGGDPIANTGIILSTTDGGSTWSASYPGCLRLYYVDIVNANVAYACGNSGTIIKYDSNVGIMEHQMNAVSFSNYPNPFSNITTIDCGAYVFRNNPVTEVYDITGKSVSTTLSQKGSAITIEKGCLSNGIYMYKILDGNMYIGSGKVVIQ